MKKSILLILFLVCVTPIFAQDFEYSILTIPKDLTANANAVLRKNDISIVVNDIDDMEITVSRIITILNKMGDKNVDAVVGYDNNSKISKIEATVYNAFGSKINKYKKSDFFDVSAVDGGTLYSDSRVLYLDYTPTTYPYTVHFEYQYKTSSTGFLPNFIPVESYYLSVQEYNYTAQTLKGDLRVKEKNFENYTIDKSIATQKVHFKLKNFNAIEREALSEDLHQFTPVALVALNNFKTDGVTGFYTNWDEFGKWMYNSLIKDRAQIDDKTKSEILDLVKHTNNPVEKAKIVYNYVQNKTRYISVQVGIGGIQPIAANEVDKLGYGDCKGLTNYTKALLDVVGVTSYYTHVEADYDDQISFETDFASLEQGNHVILNVPINGEDIWLECTSQTSPFGFIGGFTDDRKVLVITPEGGIIKHTKSYKNQENSQIVKATIQLLENGGLTAQIDKSSKDIQYSYASRIDDLTQDEIIKTYKSDVWDYINNLEILKYEKKNDKDGVLFKEHFTVEVNDFASISNNDYIIRVNVFNRNSYVPVRYRNRQLPFKINRGFVDKDEFIFSIPSTYSLGALPENQILETKFGTYTLEFNKIDDAKFTYKKTLFIKAGTYPKEDYNEYREFRRSISKLENLRIALTKKP